MNNYLY